MAKQPYLQSGENERVTWLNNFALKLADYKALFGIPNAGKRLYCFLRWSVLSEPEKSGPYAQVMTIVISD